MKDVEKLQAELDTLVREGDLKKVHEFASKHVKQIGAAWEVIGHLFDEKHEKSLPHACIDAVKEVALKAIEIASKK